MKTYTPEFLEALRAVQQEASIVVKDRFNTETKSRFVAVETLLRIVKPLCFKNGFTVLFKDGRSRRPNWTRQELHLVYKTGETMTVYREYPVPVHLSEMNAVQAMMAIATYATRRLLCDVFFLTISDDDTDGNLPKAPEGARLNDSQVMEVESLVQQCTAAGRFNYQGFLKYFEVGSIRELPAHRYREIITMLKRRLSSAEGSR